MQEKRTGGISVQTEHIFPIIKKWLYSEKEIFIREIVSNAVDAVTKCKRLSSLGQADFSGDTFRIDVTVDKDAGTLTVSDNGIGMTEEELTKYICNIALSGALDFIEKYEGKEKDAGTGIIGHFGLGFYSAFMAADRVELVTKSYLPDAKAVRWSCEDAGDYEISDDERSTHGTDVIMHISGDNEEYLDESRIRSILQKYCSFMPVEIYLHDACAKDEEHTHDDWCNCDECKDGKEHEKHEEKPINDTNPLWQKSPSDCTEEEYADFYHKVFPGKRDPLFHIHINADYPLNFKGILYFPKLEGEFDTLEGEVKLYYNSVFVADNIKEVIPEYMLMLCGVLDCPDLPLNVSRSYLQNNTYVSKLSAHISKKVADKLSSMMNTERESYEKIWNDIRTFIEYGCLRDRKFAEKVKDSVLFSDTDGKCATLSEYLEGAKEKHENTVYYTTDKIGQAQYISMYRAQDIRIVILDTVIDSQYITMLERDNSDVKFKRVDSDISDVVSSGEGEKNDAVRDAFVRVSGDEKLEVKFSMLKDETVPAILSSDEQSRRFEDMMKIYGMNAPSQQKPVLIVNSASALIKKLSDKLASGDGNADKIASYIYKLATLSYRRLSGDEMSAFMKESCDILSLI